MKKFYKFLVNKLMLISIAFLFYSIKVYDLLIYKKENYKIYIACAEFFLVSVAGYYFYKNNKLAKWVFFIFIGFNGIVFIIWGFLRIIFDNDLEGLKPGILGLYFICTIITVMLNERKSAEN
jgi:hypothetical protein